MNELELFSRRLQGLLVKRPGVAVCLWGEPGIGKTYTAAKLLSQTPCRHLSVHVSLAPATLALALPTVPSLPLWAERALQRAAEASAVDLPGDSSLAGALAEHLSRLAPFVLHFEDLHEAEPRQLEFVLSLARLVSGLRGVGLLVTGRQVAPAPFTNLRVGPLDTGQLGQYLEAAAGAALPLEAVTWIGTRAAGNPLFALEYFRTLARMGFLWNDTHRWRWRQPEHGTLPTTVEALIELVLRSSVREPALQAVLTARALLGTDPSEAAWLQVAGVDSAELKRACQELTRSGVLYRDRFVHPLYREVLLQHLPQPLLRDCALRALQATADTPGLVADLVVRAGLPPGEALAWLKRAGARAEEQGNTPLAARLNARAALVAAPAEAARLALMAALGLRGTAPAEATQLAESAAQQPEHFAEATWLQAELLAQQGELAAAEASLDRLLAHEDARADDRDLGSRADLAGLVRRLTLRAAARNHTGVLALWSDHPELQIRPVPAVVAAVAFGLATNGQSQKAVALATSALAQPGLDALVLCQLHNALGAARYGVNDFAGAQEWYSRAAELAHQAGLEGLETMYLVNRAVSLGEQGEHRQMVTELEIVARRYLDAGQPLALARTQVNMADALLDLGEYERSEALLLGAHELLRPLGCSEHLIECEYRLSILYRHWAPAHGAVLAIKYAQSAVRQARLLGNPRCLIWSLAYAAIAESRGGEAALAHHLAQEGVALAEQLNSPGLAGMSRFALAHALEALRQPAEALLLLEEVEATLSAQGVSDAAQEVGLEADRLAGRQDRAAERAAWFKEREMINLWQLASRYFPALQSGNGVRMVPVQALPPQLCLDVLGELRFGPPAAPVPVRGRQRRALLAALFESRLRGRSEASRTELIDALYPGADEVQAAASLKELVHQTRSALGAVLIRTTAGGYALGEVQSDAETFLKTGDTRLWRDPYLSGTELEPDGLLQETLYEALRKRAAALPESDPEEAVRIGRLLSEADPYDARALTLTLRALRASGNHRTLKRYYDAARSRWDEIGEVLPDDWAAFLAGAGSAEPA